MRSIVTMLMAIGVAVASSGCSMMAPQYTASIGNVQTLKDAGDYSAKVGSFDAAKDKAYVNPLPMRGSTLASPYNASYANYVGEALKQELSLAKKLSSGSNTEITGTVLKNDLDVSGFTTGFVEIRARFIVKRDQQVKYDQVKFVKHQFPSSFAAAVAFPKAIEAYPVAVQMLLSSLYTDPAFIAALK